MPWATPMQRDLAALQNTTFDLLIIGGGVSGACLAHDAALRDLSVALVERQDFGSATSAASSKLIHGGVRHLQQAQLGKLREAARERSYFQAIAPHLAHYVPFLIPTYKGFLTGRAILQTATVLYDLLCADLNRSIRDPAKQIPKSHCYDRWETLARVPLLADQPGLTGALVVYESHMHSSERMTLAFLKAAARNGAVIANYLEVEGLVADRSRVRGVRVRDRQEGTAFEIRTRLVANAAGPWIPDLNHTFKMTGPGRTITGFSKGAHVVTRQLVPDYALVLRTRQKQQAVISRGGRHLFVIPWRQHSLIGTTNVPFAGHPDDALATADDINTCLEEIHEALPEANVTCDDVRHAYAGLYPLTAASIRPDVYQGSSEYQVIDHARSDNVDGFISVLGAKYTTARALAEHATDLIVRKLGLSARPCRTTVAAAAGGAIDDLASFTRAMTYKYAGVANEQLVQHWVNHYGIEVDEVLATTWPGLVPLARVSPGRNCVEAEIAYAATEEMALRLDDVIFRRTGLGTLGHPGATCVHRCADIMAGVLHWSDQERQNQINRVEELFPTRRSS